MFYCKFTSPARLIPVESVLSFKSISIQACAKDLYENGDWSMAQHRATYQNSGQGSYSLRLADFWIGKVTAKNLDNIGESRPGHFVRRCNC